MPILGPVPSGEVELAQGDLLADVYLCEANAVSGKPDLLPNVRHALVISRDCVGANKPRVVVAPVLEEKFDLERTDDVAKAYEALKKRLATLRDGGASPDRLYLGAWGDAPRRMAAHLDRLATLALPEDASARAAWVAQHRRARLTDDFLRALPVRLFWAFGKVGFDDIAWYPTQDLQAIVYAGRARLSELETQLNTRSMEANTGATGDEKRNAGLDAAVEKARAARDRMKAELDCYERELEARR
jgi:hypothetical protein